jgi:hypothetical protein
MKLKEFLEEVEGIDPEIEIQIRIAPVDQMRDYPQPLEEFFGDYCEVSEAGNILIEYGKLIIIGDYNDES